MSLEEQESRDYWNTYLENNALRVGLKDTDAGAFLSFMIEGAGDILREITKEYSDIGYIMQKVTRIRTNLHSRDWTDPLSIGEEERLEDFKEKLIGLPIPTARLLGIKELIGSIANRDVPAITTNLDNVEVFCNTTLPNPIQYGTCYEDAWRFLMKEEEGILIHGSVLSEGRRINHAWVETETGYIWEPQTKQYFTHEAFQIATSPIEEYKYSVEEAAIMLTRVGMHGPWTDEERAKWLV